MDLGLLATTFLNGLTAGGLYALVAIGFGVVYKTTQVFNFAQGAFAALGAYMCYAVVVTAGLPYPVGLLVGCVSVGAVAVVAERLVLRNLYKYGGIYTFIATIGLALAIQSAIQLIWGPILLTIPSQFGADPVDVLGITIVPERIWILAISMGLAAGLYAYFRRTRFGKAMRAAAQDRRVSSLLGIDVNRTFMAAFFLSGVLGALAGGLIAPTTYLKPTMGSVLGVPGMIAALIGGLGSFPGAVVGGLILGVLQAFGVLLIDPRYGDIAVFAVLVVMLIVRPSGIFGEEATIGRRV